MERELTPEQFAYLDKRYNDLKQIYEAVISYHDYEMMQDNHLWTTICCEFNYLAAQLGFEDENAFLDRLVGDNE